MRVPPHVIWLSGKLLSMTKCGPRDMNKTTGQVLKEIFGMKNRTEAVQDVGSIETHEGRVITFPIILQYRVQPIKLRVPTKPGHRRILALFIVDPNIRIISTAHIPCQRRDWWAEPLLARDGPLAKLPPELRNLVCDFGNFPLTLKEGKILRGKLMEERKGYNILYSQDRFESFEISPRDH